MIRVGSLCLVKPMEKSHPGWTVLWTTPKPSDLQSQSILENCLVMAIEVQNSYVKVLAPQGQGWLLSGEIREVA